MFKKGFSTILVVVIVLVVIGGGVLVWQYWPGSAEESQEETDQPVVEEEIDETADWQTYSNEWLGFEIKYPIGSEFSEVNSIGPESEIGPEFSKEGQGVVFMDISKELMITLAVTSKSGVADIFGNFSTIAEAKTNFEENNRENSDSTEAKIITIDGQDVLRITVFYESVGSDYATESALLSKGERLFWMRQKYSVSPDTFNQMLSTFKFLIEK